MCLSLPFRQGFMVVKDARSGVVSVHSTWSDPESYVCPQSPVTPIEQCLRPYISTCLCVYLTEASAAHPNLYI